MILCCGEAVIDMLPDDSADDGVRPVTGGAAVNSAIALARLDQPVAYWGGVSTDQYGTFLMNSMAREGIDLSRVTPIDAPTMRAIVRLENGSPQFSFENADGAGRQLSAASLPDLQGVDALVFGGLSLIHPPAAGAFEALMQAAGPARLTLLDANIRPALVDEEAGYRARLRRMMAMADILKLSDEDIGWLAPDPPEVLLSGRTAVVVHTHGAGGATLYSRHGATHVPAEAVSVIDTVGAGDTFNAGFLAGLADHGVIRPDLLALAKHDALRAAAALGVRAAMFSVTRAGANPPTRKDITCAP